MPTFGATAGFGSFAGWVVQTSTGSLTSSRVVAGSKTNNEAGSNLADSRRNVTTTYKAAANYAAAAPTLPSAIGALVNSILLTSIQVSTSASDFATMTLSGHEHVSGTDGAGLRSVAHGMTLTKGFGANDFGTSGGDSCNSSSFTVTCDHAEVQDGDGDTAAGENHNARVELQAKRLSAGAALPAGYDETEASTEAGNDNFVYSNVSGIKALAFAE